MLFKTFPPLLLLLFTITEVSALCYNASICTTRVCNEVARNYRTSINIDIRPCEDFYEFVCSGWKSTPPAVQKYVSDVSSFYATSKTVLNRITYSISNYHAWIEKSSALTKLKQLYVGCLNQESSHIEGDIRILRNALENIGGCPMIGSKLSTKYSVVNSLAMMLREYDINDVIFSLSTVQVAKIDYVKGVSALIPHIKPGTLIEEWTEESKTLLKIYIEFLFFIRKGKDINSEDFYNQLNDIITFERKLKKLIFYRNLKFPNYVKSLYHLQHDMGETMNITKFFEKVYTNLMVSSEMAVAVDNIEYMKDVAILLGQTNKTIIANYLCLRTINKLKEYLPSPSRKNPSYCAKTVFEHMEVAVAYIYENNYVSDKVKIDVHRIANTIRSFLIEAIHGAPWLSATTRDNATLKLTRLNVNVGYPFLIRTETALQNYYEKLGNIDQNNFFQSILNCRKFMAYKKIKFLQLAPDIKNQYPLSPFQQKITYIQNGNFLSIPISNLIYPFYEYELPAWQKFGGIGSDIAKEMIHSVDLQGNFFDEYGNYMEQPWATWHNRKSFERSSECFEIQYDEYFEIYNVKGISSKETVYEDTALNAAIYPAFMGYKNYVEIFGIEINKQLPHINLTSDQLFFVSYAYKSCGSGAYYQESEDKHATPFNIRVIGALSNSPEFQEYFNCRPGEGMYTSENICYL